MDVRFQTRKKIKKIIITRFISDFFCEDYEISEIFSFEFMNLYLTFLF